MAPQHTFPSETVTIRALAFATYSTALIVEFRCSLTFCNAMYDNPTIQLLSFCRQPIDTQVVVYMYYVVLSPSLVLQH